MAGIEGRSQAGGIEAVSKGSITDFFSSFNEHVSEHRARGKAATPGSDLLMVKGSIDRQKKVPTWLNSNESIAIDGSPLSTSERADSYLGRYARELEIGDAIQRNKKAQRHEEMHNIIGGWNNIRRAFGIEKKLKLDPKQIEEEYNEKWRREVDEMSEVKASGSFKKSQLSWSNIMTDLQQHKPVSKMAQSYRPRVDVYGVDDFLDSGLSVVVGCTKWALIVGGISGSFRGTRSLISEMSTILSSGFSFLVMVNFIMVATALKYGMFAFISSSMFVLGDRSAKWAKKLTYRDQREAERRSMPNYVAGFAFSLAPVGFTPYWFFNDVRLGLRYALSGAVVGGLTGLLVSRVVDRLGSVNLQRINASDRELRRYEALLRRQKEWFEIESQRRKEIMESATENVSKSLAAT